MNIAIIGAGLVGTDLARLLAADPDISRITCLSRADADFAGIRRISSPKIVTHVVDAAHLPSVSTAIVDSDLLINASLPRFNETLLSAVLLAGCDYLDMASELEDLKNPEQLAFHEKFVASGRLALINAGVAPGLTNTLVRLLLDEHPGHDRFRIRLLEDQGGEELVFSWSPETTIDDVTAPPLIYVSGAFDLTAPMGDPETFDFGPPVGNRTVYALYGDEVATIPRFLKIRDLDFKSGGSDIDKARAHLEAGKIKRGMAPPPAPPRPPGRPVPPGTTTPAPGKPLSQEGESRLVVVVLSSAAEGDPAEVAGYRIVFPDILEIRRRSPESTYISWPTAISAYAFVKAFPETRQAGVLPPEVFSGSFIDKVLSVLRAQDILLEHYPARV